MLSTADTGVKRKETSTMLARTVMLCTAQNVLAYVCTRQLLLIRSHVFVILFFWRSAVDANVWADAPGRHYYLFCVVVEYMEYTRRGRSVPRGLHGTEVTDQTLSATSELVDNDADLSIDTNMSLNIRAIWIE